MRSDCEQKITMLIFKGLVRVGVKIVTSNEKKRINPSFLFVVEEERQEAEEPTEKKGRSVQT